MSYTNGLDKPTLYFNTKLYAGNSGTQSITGVGFQPDFLWIKRRTIAGDHNLVDIIRTSDKTLISNDTGAEYSNATITSFDSDGFSLSGSDGALNASGSNYVAWNWLASNTTASNTDGSITSTVSANTTAGFSVVSYSGSNSNVTVGHGINTPKMIFIKNRTSTSSWTVYHESIGNGHRLVLNSSGAKESTNQFSFGTSPTSSVFALGGGYNDVCASGQNYVAYCFAEKKGYSKFGSYTGTSSQVFIYTGFKPKFILIKKSSETASWHLFDTSRTASNGGNQLNKILFPNLSNAEADDSYNYVDANSNGFRCYSGPSGQGTETNKNGETFIYMCFAESPFVTSTGIPTTAR